MGDERRGCRDERRGAAIVAGQEHLLHAGHLGKAEEKLRVAPPKAVDGLVRIADGKDLGSFSQDPHQFELAFVQVLELVHKKVLQGAADLLPESGIRLEPPDEFRDDGIQVDGLEPPQFIQIALDAAGRLFGGTAKMIGEPPRRGGCAPLRPTPERGA